MVGDSDIPCIGGWQNIGIGWGMEKTVYIRYGMVLVPLLIDLCQNPLNNTRHSDGIFFNQTS